MSGIKDAALKFITCRWIDWRYIGTLNDFINKKIDSSRINIRRNSYVLQLIKVFKYLIVQSCSANNGVRQKVHLSLPYFVCDVAKMPSEVKSISNLKINPVDLFKILGLFIFLVLFADRKRRGHRAYVIGVISIAMIYYKAVKRSGANTVHFHGFSYVPEAAAFVHILAHDKSIASHYHEYVSFIDDSVHIVTGCLHNTNEVSSKYVQKFAKQYYASEYVYDVSLADLIVIFNNKPKAERRIGIYSSAFYCRIKHGYLDDEIIKEGIIKEKKMFLHLYDYALTRPDVEFVIYPHFERGVEPYEKAAIHYRDILKLKNVLLADAHVKSSDEHASIELGLTTISNVFWDRLNKGAKTILINPLIADKFINNSGLANVSVSTEKDSFDEQIDRFLEMNGEDYIKLLV